MIILFTDLDGTLLDHDTYAWEAAREAVDLLKRRGIPWIMVTSKTRAEVEHWRRLLGNPHPFVVENGGAAYIPNGCFPFPIPGAMRQGDYSVLEWGARYPQLVRALRAASGASGCRVRAFHGQTVAEIASACNLPLELAELARRREYDEPFDILDPDAAESLTEALEAQGVRWTRGGRFWHVTGAIGKAHAVAVLLGYYRWLHGSVQSAGLGDACNDAAFLRLMDIPVVVRSLDSSNLLTRVPRARLTRRRGPEGWNEAVLHLLHSATDGSTTSVPRSTAPARVFPPGIAGHPRQRLARSPDWRPAQRLPPG